MEGTQGSCGGSRRRFLKTAAATGAALSATSGALAVAAPDEKELPQIILGKTGAKVSRLGMGTSWDVAPGFVQEMLKNGVRYIDTAEGYSRGQAEKQTGLALERSGLRKEVYLVTKTNAYGVGRDPAEMRNHLDKSLERLRTDHVDSFYMHGMTGGNIPVLKDPAYKAAFEALKKAGKIRFAGLSCHDKRLPEVVEAAAECGWIDQIMIQYNYRTMDADVIRRAVDKASKANLGLVAMKTQGGAGSFQEQGPSPKFDEFKGKGFNKYQAAIKAVFADERFQVVVSEMTNRDQFRDNTAAAREPLTAKQARLLEEHRVRTAHLYCHGCGHLCETAAKGVPVATVLRYLRYYEVYGKRQEARALYQALPPEARALAEADLPAAQAACPHGLPVVDLITRADKALS
ncbi:MAG TPA: aldo/keto reductase [Isosphaeraceae bacterium]|jgi:hypothetical protein|nr:aldo/keto reductase [Isosphaeraceae bacterium]